MGEVVERQKKGRRSSLDILRLVACGAVVLMHTVSGVLNGNFDMAGYERRECAFRAIIDITAWSVPVFLIISGFFLLDPQRKISWKDCLLRYCRRIFLALILFGIPYSLLELLGGGRSLGPALIGQAIWNTAIGKSWAHMWYLYVILVLYAVTPALKWGLEKVPEAAVYLFLAALAILCGFLPFAERMMGFSVRFHVPQAGIYLFYYMMGYVFCTRKNSRPKWEGVLCFLAFGLILVMEVGSRFLPGYAMDMAYCYPPTLMAALLLFNGCLSVSLPEKEGPARILAELVGMTFGIYLIHPVFLNFFYKYCGISLMNFRFYVGVPLFFGIAFCGAAAVAFLLRRIPFLRKYVL